MSPTHFTFIDLENVPHVDLSLLEGQPIHTTILIGARQKKLELSLVQRIHRLGKQVELVEVGASGPNALDLTLACYLGRALERHPKASFSIISRDRDFDPMIAHLIAQGVSVARHAGIHARTPAPKRAAPVPVAAPAPRRAPSPEGDRAERIIARLMNPDNRNRPNRRRGLLAQIKSSLGKAATDADAAELVHALEQRGLLAIDGDGRVVYR